MESVLLFVFIILKYIVYIGKDEILKLKNFFGVFFVTAVIKVCYIVKSLILFFLEDFLVVIDKRIEGKDDKIRKEFGSDIKFMLL